MFTKILPILVLLIPELVAQVEMEMKEQERNSTSSPSPIESKILRVCTKSDEISNTHCSCDGNVVSCDFGSYNGTEKVELDLYGFQFPGNASRVCFCNTPPNLHLKFSSGNFLQLGNGIQRFDLYNLTGVTHIQGGFNRYFTGDLVMSNVHFIPEIQGFDFGRGSDDDLEDVEAYGCCSPVQLSPKFTKPVLYVEDTRIGIVNKGGFNDNHLWRTVIFRHTLFDFVDKQGIFIDSELDLNVAVLSSEFRNVTYPQSLQFSGASNLLLAGNYFTKTVHPATLGGVSYKPNSSVVLVNNWLLNAPYLNLDASNVVVHHNLFDLWDNYTFHAMKNSRFNRTLSLQYNYIDWDNLKDGSLFNYTGVRVSDNVLGTCNCSRVVHHDEVVRGGENWCFTGLVRDVGNQEVQRSHCSLKLDAATSLCNSSSSSTTPGAIVGLCGKESLRGLVGFEEVNETSLLLGMLAHESDFVKVILRDFGSLFNFKNMHGITLEDETSPDVPPHGNKPTGAAGNPSISNKTDSGGSHAGAVVVTIMVLVVLLVGAAIGYRNRRSWFNRCRGSGYHSQLDEQSREVMI